MGRSAGEVDIRSSYLETIDGLYAFVSRRCEGDRDLTEDIVQETWLRAVRAWHVKGIPDNPQAWLTTVSRNLLANHYRSKPSEPFDDTIADPAAESDSALAKERTSLVGRALTRLSGPHRSILSAFHFNRQPVADIAAAQGISERAVEGRLRRARQQLRHQIESDPETEGDAK